MNYIDQLIADSMNIPVGAYSYPQLQQQQALQRQALANKNQAQGQFGDVLKKVATNYAKKKALEEIKKQVINEVAEEGAGNFFNSALASDAPTSFFNTAGEMPSSLLSEGGTQIGSEVAGESATSALGGMSPLLQGGLGAAGIYGGVKGIQGGLDAIKAGKAEHAALQGGLGTMGLLGGTGALAGALGGGSLAGLASLSAFGPAGLIAAAVMAGLASQNHESLKKIRQRTANTAMENAGILDKDVGGIKGDSGFDLGNGKFLYTGLDKDESKRLSMHGGDIDPNVFMNQGDLEDFQKRQEKGFRYQNEIDWTNPNTGRQVAAANPLSYLLMGGDADALNQIPNAYLSNAQGMIGDRGQETDFLKGLYQKAGYDDPQKMISAIGELSNQGKLDKWNALAAQNEINRQYGLAGYGESPELRNAVDASHQTAFEDYLKKERELRGDPSFTGVFDV